MNCQVQKEKNYYCSENMKLSYKIMNNMRKEKVLCDLTIKIGSKDINAHRIVLASNSEYFEKMLTGSFHESNSKEICINEISSSALELIIDYMYTSCLNINVHNVQDLLKASNLLLIDNIYMECVNFLKESISIDNCLELMNVANSNNVDELYNACLSFAALNFSLISSHISNFCSLSSTDILGIIERDDVNEEEVYVYESIMLWVRNDLTNRHQVLPELLKYLKISMIPVSYFMKNIVNDNLIKSKAKCFLQESFEIYLSEYAGVQTLSSSFYENRYKLMNNQLIVVCFQKANDSFGTLKWITTGNGNVSSNAFKWYYGSKSIILKDGRIFRIVISQELDSCSACIFNGQSKVWKSSSLLEISNAEEVTGFLDLIEVDGFIFALSQSGFFANYNIEHDEWTLLEENEFPGRLVESNGRIISVDYYSRVLEYDKKIGNWMTLSVSFSVDITTGFSICSFNEFIYVIGGCYLGDYIKSVKSFNTITYMWSDICDMNVEKHNAGAVAVNGLIYVIGNDSFEVYNTHLKKWTLCEKQLFETMSDPSSHELFAQAFIIDVKSNVNSKNASVYYS